MRKFKHLTKTSRLQLEAYLKINMPVKEIAEHLNVHISTIYREIKRGKCELLDYQLRTYVAYSPDIAEEHYQTNLKDKGADIKLGNDYEFVAYVEKRIINDHISPCAVLGEIKFKNMDFKTKPCKNTLYSWIYKGFFPNLEIKHLNMKSKEKKKRRNVVAKRPPRGTSIEQRPKEILERKTFGHWEMDCVCGSSNSTLLVLTERLTRKEIIMKMPNQKSESVIHSLNILETKYGKMFRKIFLSITVDNGSEFADSIALETSKTKRYKRTKLYYCHPYCSCERGTNERINREIRRLIPKGSDLSKYTDDDIQKVENWVNDYPREVLGFNTSKNLFNYYITQLV